MSMRQSLTIALLATALATGGALAQNNAPSDPMACAPGERMQPGEHGGQPGAKLPDQPSTTGKNLSDRLARNNGVICPPSVDPHIKAPTPEVGKMPVIPPPGTPGGDQSVQPK
jgi:hypothetical protein